MTNNNIDLTQVASGDGITLTETGVINLTKGGSVINLTKAAPTLNIAQIGLGWTSPDGKAVDLDLSAFCLDKDGVSSAAGFLFYNTVGGKIYDGALMHSGDDLDGTGSEEGDDETIIADLSKIPTTVVEVVFVATIHEEVSTGMKFSTAKDAYMRICDGADDREVLKFNLTEDFSNEDSVEFISLKRNGTEWEVKSVADGSAKGLQGLCEKFKLNAEYK